MAGRRALVFVHAAHEDLAGFAAPIKGAGFAIETVHAPTARLGNEWFAADLVVVMGGPMGVYEREPYPWLGPEIAALRERIGGGGATLGICLGCQLVAAALGAEVRPGPVREVGFAPVRLTAAGTASPLRHLAGVPLLHWHGDTFDTPAGAERLAETDAYADQAFRLGRHLLALQFHPEIGEPGGFEPWLAGADDYLAAAGTTADALRADHARYGPAAVAAGRAMLAEWLAGLD